MNDIVDALGITGTNFGGPAAWGAPYFNVQGYSPFGGAWQATPMSQWSTTFEGRETMDLALVRSFAVAERVRLDLRAESFNALNHSNWGTPNRFVNTPQFGTITEASTPGREFQLNARLSF